MKIAGSIAGVLLFIIIFLGSILLMNKRSELNPTEDSCLFSYIFKIMGQKLEQINQQLAFS